MNIKKIFIVGLSLAILSACSSTSENKDILTSEEQTIGSENESRPTNSSTDTVDRVGANSDLFIKNDLGLLEDYVFDFAEKDPSELGLSKVDEDPEDILAKFFDQDLTTVRYETALASKGDEGATGQVGEGKYVFDGEEVLKIRLKNAILGGGDEIMSMTETLVDDTGASDFAMVEFDPDGNHKVTEAKEAGSLGLEATPNLITMMRDFRDKGNIFSVYEDESNIKYLYFDEDSSKVFDLLQAQYLIDPAFFNQDKLKGKLALVYSDGYPYPSEIAASINDGNGKLLISTAIADYNKLDDTDFKPVSELWD